MRRVRLGDIATARAGDKGDISNICVFARSAEHFAAILDQVTPEAIHAAYPALFRGPIERFPVAHLNAINFVIANGLEGGVNSSLNLDAHGKSFSFLLLDLEVSIDSEDQDGRQKAAATQGG